MLAATVHMEITALWAAPLQGRTLNSWFAPVVGRRIVEHRSLSMNGIDTLAHTGDCRMSCSPVYFCIRPPNTECTICVIIKDSPSGQPLASSCRPSSVYHPPSASFFWVSHQPRWV